MAHIRRCRRHVVWTLVSTTCSLHLTVSPLSGTYFVRSDSLCAYTDASPGAIHRPRGICDVAHIRRCRRHVVWTLVSTTCSLHLTVSPLSGTYFVRSDSLCAYTDASPGAGSLVGRESSKSLGTRLLVSVLRRMSY